MQGNESLRQYLQYHANNHPSAAKRVEAQALLNKVGDDGKLDGNFLTGQRGGFLGMGTREQTSNGIYSFNSESFSQAVVDEFICQLARQVQQKKQAYRMNLLQKHFS